MKIAVLANLKEDAPISPGDPPGRWDDLDERPTVDAILDGCIRAGHTAQYFPATLNLIKDLAAYKPDLCFNTSEGFIGESREAQIPSLLDMMGIPYTGSGVLGMSLAHNKDYTKRILLQNNLPTGRFFIVNDPDHIPPFDIRYPLFVKPAHEGSSIGINNKAIVNNKQELEAQVHWVWDLVRSKVLVEEYIKGREVTISILANEILPIVEIISPIGFYSIEQKESNEHVISRVCPANLPKDLEVRMQHAVLQAMQALALDDFSRFDIRINETGKFFFLEVNPLPLIFPDPKEASFIMSAQSAGIEYPQMVNKILQSAIKRWKLSD